MVVENGKKMYASQTYLSRGENKILILAMKFLQITFLESIQKKTTVILLDDLFSELDFGHIRTVLGCFGERQMLLTTQNLNKDLAIIKDFHTININ